MGYELRICRYGNVDRERPITLEEWINYINSDPSLEQKDDEPGYCEWNGHPEGYIEGSRPWLRYSEGCISTRHPDEYLTLKMYEIAEKLKTELSNDEAVLDDVYRQELEDFVKKSTSNRTEPGGKKKNWWRFW